jgi:hypothetical protein
MMPRMMTTTPMSAKTMGRLRSSLNIRKLLRMALFITVYLGVIAVWLLIFVIVKLTTGDH